MGLDFDANEPYPFGSGFSNLYAVWLALWSIRIDLVLMPFVWMFLGFTTLIYPVLLILLKIAYIYIPPITMDHLYYLLFEPEHHQLVAPPLFRLVGFSRKISATTGDKPTKYRFYTLYVWSYLLGMIFIASCVTAVMYIGIFLVNPVH